MFSDYERNVTSQFAFWSSAVAHPGVHAALWKLFLALIFKIIMMIFTIGIRVSL